MTDEEIINHTQNWINDVVIGCNFCPFASREVKRGSIRFRVAHSPERAAVLELLAAELEWLNHDPSIATTLLILPEGFASFNDYLFLLDLANQFLEEFSYEGVYQLASFHPAYLFVGAAEADPANYTNRSPYPMLHILREDDLTNALTTFPDPGSIPERNIAFARKKGLEQMVRLWNLCFGDKKEGS